MRVGLRRMMTEMLSSPARLVLTIASNHAPAELKSEDHQNKVDEASGGHGKKYTMEDRLSCAFISAELGNRYAATTSEATLRQGFLARKISTKPGLSSD